MRCAIFYVLELWRRNVQGQKTSVTFETRPLKDCIKLTKSFDRSCFPTEMWLDANGLQRLIEGGADTTILSLNGKIIGQAITLPEGMVEDELREADSKFTATEKGMYSYSEAILPTYQKLGYGGLLLHEITLRMKLQGYTSISAHVRAKNGWNVKRRRSLHVIEERSLYNFWDDPLEIVSFQRAML